MRRAVCLLSPAFLFSSGCAALPPAQAGQVAGTLLGAAVAPGVGGAVGSMLGTLAGIVLQQGMDKAQEGKERADLGNRLDPDGPGHSPSGGKQGGTQILIGNLERVWVDETVSDGRVLAGHYEQRHVP